MVTNVIKAKQHKRYTHIIFSFKNIYYVSDIDTGGAFLKGEALWKKEISMRLEIEI